MMDGTESLRRGRQAEPRFDLPPSFDSAGERRVHLQALDWWTALKRESRCPAAGDAAPAALGRFAPLSLLLRLDGRRVSAVEFAGARLREESGVGPGEVRLAEIPPQAMLGRMVEHVQPCASLRLPVTFEAEAESMRGAEILYRGVLLPFVDHADQVSHVVGVVSWKEYAAEALQAELLQALADVRSRRSPH